MNDFDDSPSCCDYSSDVFKEQISRDIVDQPSGSHNPGTQIFTDQDNFNQYQAFPPTLQISTPQSNKVGKYVLSKSNSNIQNSSSSTTRHFRSPPFSVVPPRMAKNLVTDTKSTSNPFDVEDQNSKTKGNKFNQRQSQPTNTLHAVPIQKFQQIHYNSNQNSTQKSKPLLNYASNMNMINCYKQAAQEIIYCEESELTSIKQSHMKKDPTCSSFATITPQKNQPIPISPGARPVLNQNTNKGYGPNRIYEQQNSLTKQYDSKHLCHRNQSSINQNVFTVQVGTNPRSEKATTNSGSKTVVVYDEFKYFTTNTGNSHRGTIGAKQFQESVCNPELVEVQSLMNNNDNFSHKNSALSGYGPLRSKRDKTLLKGTSDPNVVGFKDQEESFSRNEVKPEFEQRVDSVSTDQKNTEASQRGLDLEAVIKAKEQELHDIFIEKTLQLEEIYTCRMNQMQEQVLSLEQQLQHQIDDNQKIVTQMSFSKQRPSVCSYDRRNNGSTSGGPAKALSDTEDSLILSEKKKKSTSNLSSSIVDVKIKPVQNLKQGPNAPQRENMIVQDDEEDSEEDTSVLEDRDRDDEDTSLIHYQVQCYNESDRESMRTPGSARVNKQENSVINEAEDSDECGECGKYKKLIFSAKEAIDDLKLEIDEWKELCASRDVELRTLQHKLSADLNGVEKNLEFDENVKMLEFDSTRPVNADLRKNRNFVQFNKKKFRSRSTVAKEGCIPAKTSILQKSILKKVLGFNHEEQYFTVEDKEVQTRDSMSQVGTPMLSNESASTTARPMNEEIQDKDNNCFSCVNCNQKNFSSKFGISLQHPVSLDFSDSRILKENQYQNTPDRQSIVGTSEKKAIQTQSLVIEQLNLKLAEQEDEIEYLRTGSGTMNKENERLNSDVQKLTKLCDQFVTQCSKTKKKARDKARLIKDVPVQLSQIQSYSILEKIDQWKRDEGLPSQPMTKSQIPRPIKLMTECVDEDEVLSKVFDFSNIDTCQPESVRNQNTNLSSGSSHQRNEMANALGLRKQSTTSSHWAENADQILLKYLESNKSSRRDEIPSTDRKHQNRKPSRQVLNSMMSGGTTNSRET